MWLLYLQWKWVGFHLWKAAVLSQPLCQALWFFSLCVCVWYKCKCVKKLLKLTWFLQIPFCLDDPGQAGDGGSLPFGNWNNKFMSWLGNAFLVVGVKMLLKEILTNMWHILLHWHFLLPSFYVPIHLPRSFSSSLPSFSPPPKSTKKQTKKTHSKPTNTHAWPRLCISDQMKIKQFLSFIKFIIKYLSRKYRCLSTAERN